MEKKRLGFSQIAMVAVVATVFGGTAGTIGGFFGKKEAARQFAATRPPLTERLPRCPTSVAELYSLDELKVMTQDAVKKYARNIRSDLEVDGNSKVTIVVTIDVEKSGDVRLRSVSAMCEGRKCERRSGAAFVAAESIFRGEQIEPSSQACVFSFEVEVPATNSSH